jgi:hypothetical protein
MCYSPAKWHVDGWMPIYELLKKLGVFVPEEVVMVVNVYEDVLRTLGLVDPQDP